MAPGAILKQTETGKNLKPQSKKEKFLSSKTEPTYGSKKSDNDHMVSNKQADGKHDILSGRNSVEAFNSECHVQLSERDSFHGKFESTKQLTGSKIKQISKYNDVKEEIPPIKASLSSTASSELPGMAKNQSNKFRDAVEEEDCVMCQKENENYDLNSSVKRSKSDVHEKMKKEEGIIPETTVKSNKNRLVRRSRSFQRIFNYSMLNRSKEYKL